MDTIPSTTAKPTTAATSATVSAAITPATAAANDIDARVSARLAAARRLRRVSLATLARAVGVSYQQIQKYESGRNRLSCGTLAVLARQLDLPVAWFYADDETAFDRGGFDHGGATERLSPPDRLSPDGPLAATIAAAGGGTLLPPGPLSDAILELVQEIGRARLARRGRDRHGHGRGQD